jgi:NADH:ubiquinone oxidoreductase subunit E
MTARTWTWIAGAAVVACVAILLTDYVLATWQAPRDDKILKNLQQQVKSDAALAAKLAAEQKRITATRRARKSRDNAAAWILIAAAAVFLTLAKKVVGQVSRPARDFQSRSFVGQAPWPARGSQPRSLPTLDLTFIDGLVAKEGRSKEGAIVLLQAIQKHYRYLPDEAIRRLCELTEITPAQFAGASSFYGQFRRTPAGKHTVRVCHGTACHVAGARQVTDELRRYLAIPDGADTDPARMFTVDEVACVGCCSLAPVLMLDGRTAGRLTPSSASAVLSHLEVTAEETQTA